MLPGEVLVAADLKSKRTAKVSIARFYVNGRLVTTDRSYPFAIKRGFKLDTRTLPSSKQFVDILVTYELGKKPGKVTKATLKKRVRISFIAVPSPEVSAKNSEQSMPPPYDPATSGFPLALDEEFNDDSLDTGLWNTGRYDTRDQQAGDNPPFSRPYNYAEGAAYGPNNVSQSGGALNLTILDSPAPGAPADLPRSTGMVNSMNKFSFKYGYVETRAMVPSCGGCWPAFWMVPEDNSWPPEIDIFEYMNFPTYHPQYPHTVFHYAYDGGETDGYEQGFEHRTSTPDGKPNEWQEWLVARPAGWSANFEETWHTYGLLWTPDYVRIYIDGQLGAEVTGASNIPQKAMYLIYQMAICRTDGTSTDGSNCTPELSTPAAGKAMKIDYLRVYTNGP